jgi:predicted dehydrogenase
MLKVGIVGSGSMGQVHAAAWEHTPARLVGIHSRDTARAQQITERYGIAAYESLDTLLADVDVIDICTPTHLHHPMALQAAAAGKHIVCEKPLARTFTDAQEMVRVCQQQDVQLLVGHVVRFFPEYARAKALIDQGAIGEVAVVRLTRAAYQPQVTGDNWFLDPAKSGGMILDLMIHDFDYARWIAGEVRSVYIRSVRGRDPQAAEDYAIALLQHTNGAISNIEGGWAYPPPLFRTALEVAGSAGLIEHPADSSRPLIIHKKARSVGEVAEVGLPLSPLAEDPYVTQIKHFYDVLTGKITEPRVRAEDGAAAVRIALAALQSAETGKPVMIEAVQ